jgi:hypothetical protein
MTDSAVWLTLAGAIAVVAGAKLAGQFLPGRWLSRPALAPVVALLTVALLAGLDVVQTFDGGGHLTLDARAAALLVAAVALWRKAPFLVVVILAAATAALLRHLGWG